MVEEISRETTAETYFARTKVDKNLSERVHVLAGLDWLRNTFAGIDSRFLVASGAGITLSDTKNLSAKTDLAFTYTFEEEVVDNPFSNGSFPGLRAGYNLTYRATESTQLDSELIGDWNLDNSEDVRVDWTNSLSVAINSSLALKPGALIRWRNEPALKEVALFDEESQDTGETVLVPLEKTDWFLDLAIVLTF
jgi:putative salt-induced outer membrane protein YdiY